jgi:hypothetical protein
MPESSTACIYCAQSDQVVPLLPFQYQGKQYWICHQHLPVLIHKPDQLADKLPGLELISPPFGHP